MMRFAQRCAVALAVALPAGVPVSAQITQHEYAARRDALAARLDSGIVIAVTSNIAHANTSSLALRVGDAFAEQTR